MSTIIKLVLSILFFLCLINLPYGFYQIVRFAALIGFAILAYKAKQQNNKDELIVYIALALLFQPFLKISLGRQLWNIIDVIVAVLLLISIFLKPKSKV
jgi:hypothetical protein